MMVIFLVFLVIYLTVVIGFLYKKYQKQKQYVEQWPHLFSVCEQIISTDLYALLVMPCKANYKPIFFHVNTEIVPSNEQDFLQFTHWLKIDDAQQLKNHWENLRQKGTAFDLTAVSHQNEIIVFYGRHIDEHDLLYCRCLNGAIQKVQSSLANSVGLSQKLQNLLNHVDILLWNRNEHGMIDWANQAYCKFTGWNNKTQFPELFGEAGRQKLQEQDLFKEKLSTVLQGDRYIFDVLAIRHNGEETGLAVNVNEQEKIKQELITLKQGYMEILDQISTSVAIFDHAMVLQFYNQSFLQLWNLDIQFLENHPTHTLVLDRLREMGGLAQHTNWRQWKESILAVYRAIEPLEQIWHLSDRRVLRVVARPHAQGGVIWLFENLTEQVELETRYNTLIKVQGETLDHLTEAVIVFGSDGKVRLINPAFIQLWDLNSELSIEGTHITQIASFYEKTRNISIWGELSQYVVGFTDERDKISNRVDLSNGQILDYMVVPLPNGETMFTFVNVTDSVLVARALQDKNNALQFVDRLRNDFVQHVSYQLRSPLTNIIGFTEFLQLQQKNDPLKSGHYLDYIRQSSQELLVLVNDILDLARVDAGMMELEITILSAMELIQETCERLTVMANQKNIELSYEVIPNDLWFEGDANRVKQIFINLLKNAITYAPSNSSVTFHAYTMNDKIMFAIHDDGQGIAEHLQKDIFKRFQAYGREKGTGLGLSIVKTFVELHGGKVWVDQNVTKGTTILCEFQQKCTNIKYNPMAAPLELII